MKNLGLNIPVGLDIAEAMEDCLKIARRVLEDRRMPKQKVCEFVADMVVSNPELISEDDEWVEWAPECDRDQFAGWLETHLP